jgi:DNA-directed RNA polymerase specialized sigma subunit
MLDYNSYSPIALRAAKQLKIRLTADDKHDVMTAIWESHQRFLQVNDAQNRELTEAESLHLNNQLHTRARGAVIDVVRFNTWSVSRELSNGVKTPKLIYQPEKQYTKVSFFDQFIEPLDFEDLLDKKFLIDRHHKSDILIEYLLGDTMKEIGARRGISEARVSQIFKEHIE